MSGIPNLILTDAGATLLAKTPIGSPIPVTKWQIGTGVLPDGTDLRARTKLVAVFTEVTIARVENSGNECLVTGNYINTGFGAFTWSETGLFVQDPDVGEILYAYGNSGSAGGAPIPAGSTQYREVEFGVQLVFDVAANVVANISSSLIYATREDLKTKADLVGGQVPYSQTPHITANKTLYVDGTTGSDSNPGTQALPFKTIQAAVNSLPKDMGTTYTVTIEVAEGDYDETVAIIGFQSGNLDFSMKIKAAEGASVNVSRFNVRSCTNILNIENITINGTQGPLLNVGNSKVMLSAVSLSPNGSESGGYSKHIAQCTSNGYLYIRSGVQLIGDKTWSGLLCLGGAIIEGTGPTIQGCATGITIGSSSSISCGIVMFRLKPVFSDVSINASVGAGSIGNNIE